MWTTLIGPVTVIASALFVSFGFMLFYIAWIALTRFIMSVAFFRALGKVYLTLPAMMYANQILNSVLKVYLLFRLPRQRWSNRNNQRIDPTAGAAWKGIAKSLMAAYITTFWVMLFVFIILVYLKLVSPVRLDLLV
jgi:glycosyltransferase Alg8